MIFYIVLGTGDIGVDMDNQVKANSIRIQILEEQNQGLRRTIQKLLQQQSHGGTIGGATEVRKSPISVLYSIFFAKR